MSQKPLHPALRMVASGALSLLLLATWEMAGRDPRWIVAIGGGAAAAFVLLVPVMARGNSSQKMVAALLLFVPCLGLVFTVFGLINSL